MPDAHLATVYPYNMDTTPPWRRTREEFSAALKRSSAEPKAQAPWPQPVQAKARPVQAKARPQAQPVQAKAPGHLGPGLPMGSAPGQFRPQQPPGQPMGSSPLQFRPQQPYKATASAPQPLPPGQPKATPPASLVQSTQPTAPAVPPGGLLLFVLQCLEAGHLLLFLAMT